MTDEEIVASEAFRTINYLIECELKEISWRVQAMRNAAAVEGYPVRIRTHAEVGRRGKCESDLDVASSRELLSVARFAHEVADRQERIGDLQRLKLRLLNDVDFQDRDFAARRAVFGDRAAPSSLTLEDRTDGE